MRRKLLPVLGIAVAAALAGAGAAAAANGGFSPQVPHSPNAQGIKTAYWVIFGFTAAIFVLVESLLVVFVWKYRSRGRARTVDGAQVHGHTRLELIWTAGPVIILTVIAGLVFYELPGIRNAPAAANPLRITVEGHQYYWQFDYPNGARTINDLHVPANQVVDLTIDSYDVVHSWWIPQLGGKIQAIPGRTNTTWFEADSPGVYLGQCAELCGLYHAAMKARVLAGTQQEYEHYVTTTAHTDLGRTEFQGVCATCHGMQGQGGYGPALSQNPILTQPSALESIVRNGRGKMPPVGNTWTAEQIQALSDFVSKNIYKGAASGG
ncbi:MAG: cytochrome c oxidase subunit II [Gaiellaceae bacterium]